MTYGLLVERVSNSMTLLDTLCKQVLITILAKTGLLTLIFKYIDMETETDIGNGAVTRDVEINPTLLGVGIGTRF